MSSGDEERLRDALHARADSVAVRDGYAALTATIEQRGVAQRHWLVAALVAVLVAGPVGGFLAGRAVASGGGDKVVAGKAASDASGSPAAPGAAPLTRSGVAAPGPLTRVFMRTTSEGVAIRVYRSTAGTAITRYDVELSTTVAVTSSSALVATTANGSRIGFDEALRFGVAEGAPVTYVTAVVGGDVRRVRAHFGDVTDEMSPVDGVVVLARQVSGTEVSLDLLDATGAVVDHRSVPVSGVSSGGASGLPCAASPTAIGAATVVRPCGPIDVVPPTLPPPGAQQPPDATAARAAIQQAFDDTYGPDVAQGTKEAAVQDGAALFPLFRQAANGAFAQQVHAVKVRIDELVFTSATHATLRYDLLIPNDNWTNRIGDAVFEEGRWKVARSTICNDLSLAAVTCPAPSR
jgi:hypothetical protein